MIPEVTFAIIASLGTLGFSAFLIRKILAFPTGDEKMQSIAQAIAEGAEAYLGRQTKTVALVALVLTILLWIALGLDYAVGFILGSFTSSLAGYIGMSVAVRANIRTTQAAKKGLGQALEVAFQGGSVTGLLVGGLALFSIALVILIANIIGMSPVGALVGLGFGGSLISVSAILLATLLFAERNANIYFPLLLGSQALIASVLGTFFVKLPKNGRIMPALYQGLAATAVFSVLGLLGVLVFFSPRIPGITNTTLFLTSLIGIVVTIGMVILTEIYTGKNSRFVKKIAEASVSGHGTNIIAGLALSMESTFLPILLIAGATLLSFSLAGLYGVAIAAVSMLSLTGIIVAIDSFGPITDNAGGIAEMSGQKGSVRKITDALDAVGNTTKAVTKSYAVASAGLAALVLFAAYTQELAQKGAPNVFSLADPNVLVGILIGASLPYLFAGLAMEAVGKAGMAIVVEIRRQFKEIKGIMQGTHRPDYARCVDIVTKAALRQMIVPALLPVVAPVVVGLVLGPTALGGLLIGVIVTGLFVAISMTTGGAALDNAKKYIEDGNFGGKGSVAHQASVTGDTVGDPYKDTAGPAINPMIKVANVVALLLAPFLV